jgi:hypothetical protein
VRSPGLFDREIKNSAGLADTFTVHGLSRLFADMRSDKQSLRRVCEGVRTVGDRTVHGPRLNGSPTNICLWSHEVAIAPGSPHLVRKLAVDSRSFSRPADCPVDCAGPLTWMD